MIQVNTDGITCRVHRDDVDRFKAACAAWEGHTGLELEFANYSQMHVRDVNNYLAVYDGGDIKRIGAYTHERQLENPFTREKQWHKDQSQLVVPKAAEARLVHGQDIADFIMHHDNPFDFMKAVKVPRMSHLEERWADGAVRRVQNTCRYYVSTEGCALTKVMPPLRGKDMSRSIGVEAGWTVKVCNDVSDFDPSTINWFYYIEEAKKLTDWVN